MRLRLQRITLLISFLQLAWLSTASSVPAQPDDAALPAFEALGTPTSPAFVLLGVAASDVQRPSTPADFAAKLGNATEQFSNLPEQFAVELAPYWLFSHPQLSWGDDIVRSPIESIQRTLTISAAKAPLASVEEAGPGVAVGASFSPLSGRVSERSVAKIRELEQSLIEVSEILAGRRKTAEYQALEAEFARLFAGTTDAAERERLRQEYEAKFAAFDEEARDDAAEDIAALLAPYEGLVPAREGLFLDVSGGAAWVFPGAVATEGSLAQWGLWSTASYRKGHWRPTVVARYLNRPNESSLSNDLPEGELIDVGARLIYNGGATGLSVEYVRRSELDGSEARHRVVGTVEYNVREDVWLIASFGRGYEADTPGSLVAQLGLAFNFSRERYHSDAQP